MSVATVLGGGQTRARSDWGGHTHVVVIPYACSHDADDGDVPAGRWVGGSGGGECVDVLLVGLTGGPEMSGFNRQRKTSKHFDQI